MALNYVPSIDASSTTTASDRIGLSALRVNPLGGLYSSSRWIVVASLRKNGPFFEFSYVCLSRACLGKMIHLYI